MKRKGKPREDAPKARRKGEDDGYDEAAARGVGSGGLSPGSAEMAGAAQDDDERVAGDAALNLFDESDQERMQGSVDRRGPAPVRELHPVDGSQNPDEEILGDDDGGDYRAGALDPLGNDRAPRADSDELIEDDEPPRRR